MFVHTKTTLEPNGTMPAHGTGRWTSAAWRRPCATPQPPLQQRAREHWRLRRGAMSSGAVAAASARRGVPRGAGLSTVVQDEAHWHGRSEPEVHLQSYRGAWPPLWGHELQNGICAPRVPPSGHIVRFFGQVDPWIRRRQVRGSGSGPHAV